MIGRAERSLDDVDGDAVQPEPSPRPPASSAAAEPRNRPDRTQCAMNTGVTTTFESTWRVTPPRSSSRTRLCE